MPHKYLKLQDKYVYDYCKRHHIDICKNFVCIEDALDELKAPRDVYPFYFELDTLNECAEGILSNKPYITYTTNKSNKSDSLYLNMKYRDQKYTLRIATHKHPTIKMPYVHWNEGLTIGDAKTLILLCIKKMCLKYMSENK